MERALFVELLKSTNEALEHAGKKRELRTTMLPPAPEPMKAREIRRLRTALNASQAVFAYCLNVSTKLVQAWESNRRQPEGPALLLLRLAERHPATVFTGLGSPSPREGRSREALPDLAAADRD